MEWSPCLASSTIEFEKIRTLRLQVWSEFGVVPDFIKANGGFGGKHDATGYHYVLHDQENLIAASRLCVHQSAADVPDSESFAQFEEHLKFPVGCLGRLVIHARFRGLGIPTAMVNARLHQALAEGCKSLITIVDLRSQIETLSCLGFMNLGATTSPCEPDKTEYVLLKYL